MLSFHCVFLYSLIFRIALVVVEIPGHVKFFPGILLCSIRQNQTCFSFKTGSHPKGTCLCFGHFNCCISKIYRKLNSIQQSLHYPTFTSFHLHTNCSKLNLTVYKPDSILKALYLNYHEHIYLSIYLLLFFFFRSEERTQYLSKEHFPN